MSLDRLADEPLVWIALGLALAVIVLLRDALPDAAGHPLTASVISAPAAVLAARLMRPQTGPPATPPEQAVAPRKDSRSCSA